MSTQRSFIVHIVLIFALVGLGTILPTNNAHAASLTDTLTNTASSVGDTLTGKSTDKPAAKASTTPTAATTQPTDTSGSSSAAPTAVQTPTVTAPVKTPSVTPTTQTLPVSTDKTALTNQPSTTTTTTQPSVTTIQPTNSSESLNTPLAFMDLTNDTSAASSRTANAQAMTDASAVKYQTNQLSSRTTQLLYQIAGIAAIIGVALYVIANRTRIRLPFHHSTLRASH